MMPERVQGVSQTVLEHGDRLGGADRVGLDSRGGQVEMLAQLHAQRLVVGYFAARVEVAEDRAQDGVRVADLLEAGFRDLPGVALAPGRLHGSTLARFRADPLF